MNTDYISARKPLSRTRVNRIKAQGYQNFSDEEVRQLAFGNRFAYRLCTTILIVAIVTANVYLLSGMAAVAFLSVILPYHVFDYIYNHGLAKRLGKPKVPKRSKQLKFACSIATVWIMATTYMFMSENSLVAYILGAALACVAMLVSTIDFCIPSILFNAFFMRKQKSNYVHS